MDLATLIKPVLTAGELRIVGPRPSRNSSRSRRTAPWRAACRRWSSRSRRRRDHQDPAGPALPVRGAPPGRLLRRVDRSGRPPGEALSARLPAARQRHRHPGRSRGMLRLQTAPAGPAGAQVAACPCPGGAGGGTTAANGDRLACHPADGHQPAPPAERPVRRGVRRRDRRDRPPDARIPDSRRRPRTRSGCARWRNRCAAGVRPDKRSAS